MQLIDRVIGTYEQVIAAHRRKLKRPNRIVYAAGVVPVGFDLDIQRLVAWSVQGDNQITDPLAVRLDIDDDATLLFDTRERAEDALSGLDIEDRPEFHVWREWRQTPLAPEANEVYMVGMDPFSRGPIRAWWRDDVAQDPTLPRSGRGPRWVGAKRVLGIFNHRLTSQDAVNRALRCVVPRVSNYRYIAEMKCEMLRLPNGCPLTGGDKLKAYGKGTYVIQSIPSIDIELDPDVRYREGEDGGIDEKWRPSTYVMERLKPWTEE